MSVSVKTPGIQGLNVEETSAMLTTDTNAFSLTDAQRTELERRVADDDAFPDDVVPWDEVKASALSRLRTDTA